MSAEVVDYIGVAGTQGRAAITDTFEKLLLPRGISTFCTDNWTRRPLHVAHGCADRFTSLISLTELEKVFAVGDFFARENVTTPQRGRGAWAPPPTSAGELYERVARGASVRIRRLETILPASLPIVVLLRDMERELGHPCDSLSCYMTPGGGAGLGPHHDETEIFTLQIHGSKRWRLYSRVNSSVPAMHDPDLLGSPAAEFVLEPGDVLYLPGGWVHDVTALTESFSMTMVFAPTRWATLLTMLTRALADHPEFIAPLPAGPATRTCSPELSAAFKRKVELITAVLAKFDADDLLSLMARDRTAAAVAPARGHLESVMNCEVELDTPVQRRPDVPVHLAVDGDQVRLTFSGGYVVALHAAALSSVRAVLESTAPFAVDALPGDLTSAAKRFLVRELIVAGLLEPIAS